VLHIKHCYRVAAHRFHCTQLLLSLKTTYWNGHCIMHRSTTIVVLIGVLIDTVPFVASQARVAGQKSPIFGCVFGGYPVNGGCCKTGNCFVPQGKCYCDVACHFFGDCCFDILAISCGELALLCVWLYYSMPSIGT